MGQASDQIYINNVTASLESNIPAGYTIAMGNTGAGYANVSTPGNLTNAGTLEPEWGTTLTVGGGTGTLTNTGTIDVRSSGYYGTIDAGTVDNSSGIVEVPYDGYLSIHGAYVQGAQGTFIPQLDGTGSETTYGVLSVSGGSTLSGTLEIDTIAGFSPTSSDSFKVLPQAR